MNAAVLTVSDGVHHGTREDRSGDTLAELLAGEGFAVERRVVPDEADEIADAIVELAGRSSLVLTTGGTGFTPRDVTPEATRRVLEREAPGHRRGDPGRCPHEDAARTALPRPRRASGRDARRQPPRARREGVATASRSCSPPSPTGSSWPPATRARGTSRREHGGALPPPPLRLARQVRAHRLRAAVRLRRRLPRRRRLPGHRHPRLAHARDGRGPHARDGAEPARRRRARRAEPADGRARDPGRRALARTGLGALRGGARPLSRGRVPARADRPLALADPRRHVRRSTRT